MIAMGKPAARRIDAAYSTLIDVSVWADLSGRQRDEIAAVVRILGQIQDGEIKAREEGTA